MNSPLRIGMVGTGWVAHQHVEGYHSELGDKAVVAAACDPRRDVLNEFADRYSIDGRYTSAAEMMSSEQLDIIVLLTPPSVRDEIIYPAIDQGINLLIEKPFAATGAKAVEYVSAAEAGGVHLAVSQNFRWFPEYQWLHERLRQPDAGTPEYLEARSFQNRPQPAGQWRADEKKLEMAIFSVHLIDRLQWLAPGEPLTVTAVTRRNEASGLPGEQFTTLIVGFDDGTVAHMTSSWMSRGLPVHDMRVDTTTGSIAVRRTHPMSGDAEGLAAFGAAEPEMVSYRESALKPHGTRTYGLSMNAFADAILTGAEARHSGRNNLRTMGIMEAAYLSAGRGGDSVEVAEALSTPVPGQR